MIRFENKESKEEILAMWQRIFHDPAPYAAFYFDEIYRGNEVLVYEDRAEAGVEDTDSRAMALYEVEGDSSVIAGMLHLNPYILQMKGSLLPSHYIVGVATDEAYRRRGIMRKLLLESFHVLREKGEMMTYLMPAQEDYYLPFDFRFGAYWREIELEYRPACSCQESRFSFLPHPEDGASAAEEENLVKDQIFCIHTRITKDYYRLLEMEAASEFARTFYVYEGDRYAGRFVVGAQDNYMLLSRISCCTEDRTAFLQGILEFCEKRYHYGVYQITLDESWDQAEAWLKSIEGVRIFNAKSRPMIMFRLLNIEKAGERIHCSTDMKLALRLVDDHIPEQTGYYLIEAGAQGCRFTPVSDVEIDGISVCDPTSKEEGDDGVAEGGSVTVGDFTDVLFGGLDEEDIERLPGLTDAGRAFMKGILPWRANCIMEYV